MNKKKLLIVAHHLTIGGAQKSLIAALKALDYEKYDVTLYLRKNRTDLLSFVDKRVRVIINDDNSHYYRKPYAIWLQLWELFWKVFGKKDKADDCNKRLTEALLKYTMKYEKERFFSSENYDIAIAYVQGYTALFVAECVNAEKKAMFFHVSVDELHDVHEKITDKFQKVVAIHSEQAELIKEWYPSVSGKVTVVENYCDKSLIEEQSKEYEIEKFENKLVLCSCGRFSPVKGFDMAVESAKILKEQNLDFKWYFVGDGPERSNIEKLINQYGLNDYICITGMQKNPYPYIKACDIYVQPSREESLGLTIIEAQHLNKPVVSTATMGGKKLIQNEENGVLCDISGKDIAENIKKLYQNQTLTEKITTKLINIDYSGAFMKYKTEWQKLLEG